MERGEGTGSLKRKDMSISAEYMPVSYIFSEFPIKVLFIAFFQSSTGA